MTLRKKSVLSVDAENAFFFFFFYFIVIPKIVILLSFSFFQVHMLAQTNNALS